MFMYKLVYITDKSHSEAQSELSNCEVYEVWQHCSQLCFQTKWCITYAGY